MDDSLPPALQQLAKLQIRLERLEKEIEETIRRLPAHSVKPPVMIDLIELEDERDRIVAELQSLKSS